MEHSNLKIKHFLIFREMELSSSETKKFQEETFRGQKNKKIHSEKIFIFHEMDISGPKKLKLSLGVANCLTMCLCSHS